ncbi:SLBB domain-containing protein [Hahella ganghwensis]|uniref:SLBB domain-containing protein n=1 Tax=Hahella ganghwensis TaxID=286420 RepID=UPI00035C67E4|nr:SLBB domain-containing protein [Hahella ganghwensis]
MMKVLFCLIFVWLVIGTAQAALPSNITQEQINTFMSLPASQREAIARQMGVELDEFETQIRSASSNNTKLEEVEVVKPIAKEVGDDEDSDSLDLQEILDRLKEEEEPEETELKPFGYDLFAGEPTTFAPVTEIPIPAEYIVGPGDVIKLQLYGKENRVDELLVTRDGNIQLPEIGPMSVAGLSFVELKDQLSRTIKEKFIGVESAVSLGELRSMRVFVLGEARAPGSYTVSSLSTITNALFVSGGILETGSLRNIQLKRNGKLVSSLDLYDLLLKGDTSGDIRLLPGDVVFIPSVGKTVAVSGEVRRPAIYELKSEKNIDELLSIAGGLSPQANLSVVKINRIQKGKNTEIIDLDLSRPNSGLFEVRGGDTVSVGSVNLLSEGFVEIQGEVTRPGNYAWRKGMRISDVLPSLRMDISPSADLNYALIVREINEQREIATVSVNLAEAVSRPGSIQDLELEELDTLLVFKRGEERSELLEPVISRLVQQSRPGEPQQLVDVAGEVRYPGQYPLPANQTFQNIIMAAGGLLDSAYTMNAEVSRFVATSSGAVKTEIIPLNVDKILKGEESIAFEGRDRIHIKRIPDYALRMSVRIEGEVVFPGEYTLQRGQKLSDLLKRAGGLTDIAFPEGAVFTRKSLVKQEKERLMEARKRLEKDLASLQLESANVGKNTSAEDISKLQSILEDVKSAKPVGRLVVKLDELLKGDIGQDVVLQDGDVFYVPQVSQSIAVIGEVQFSTSHLYESDLGVEDYIKLSGGETPQADGDRVYVVRANGSVWLPGNSSGWFSGSSSMDLKKGDTIVVPLDTDRLNSLELWTNVSQIFYQIALGAAAVGSL